MMLKKLRKFLCYWALVVLLLTRWSKALQPWLPRFKIVWWHCQVGPGSHSPVTCWFKNFTYCYCHKKGHLEKVCCSKKAARQTHNPRPQLDTNFVSKNSASDTKTQTPPVEDCSTYLLFTFGSRKNKPWMVDLLVNEKQVSMQIDTGASVSVINFETYTSLWNSPLPPLVVNEPCPKLRTYTVEEIQVLG